MLTIKPWGREERWALTDNYAGKIITIRKGSRLSRQYHKKKEESIYVLEGVLTIGLIHGKLKRRPGESYHIPPRMVHRFEATETDVKLVEISTTELSDIVRLEDDWGRV